MIIASHSFSSSLDCTLSNSSEEKAIRFLSGSLRIFSTSPFARILVFCDWVPSLSIIFEKNMEDQELVFNGPAKSEVLSVWENRLGRMKGFKKILGDHEYQNVRADFLDCLKSNNHSCRCEINFIIAQK